MALETEESEVDGQLNRREHDDTFELDHSDSKQTITVPGPLKDAPQPNAVDDSSYVPAETGDGLEEVGGLRDYYKDDRNWNPELGVETFGPQEKIMDAYTLEVVTRRAVVEALAVRDADSGIGPKTGLTRLWARGGIQERDAALDVQIRVNEDGTATLAGDTSTIVAALAGIHSSDILVLESNDYLDAGAARELVNTWESDWHSVSLEDVRLKFAITKRIQQLTGHIISDAKLASINDVKSLLAVLVTPPKPKKLADELEEVGDLLDLPNVSVSRKRISMVHKEKMVGRWKVIVQELQKRELPVIGTGDHGRYVEKEWSSPSLHMIQTANKARKLEKKIRRKKGGIS